MYNTVMLAEELFHGYYCKKYDDFKLNLDKRNDVMSGGFVKRNL